MGRTPIHPGEILAEQLEELDIKPTELARALQVPPNRLLQIVQGARGITADTALRLGHYFGTSPEFWLNLQKSYELRLAQREIGEQIKSLPTRPGFRDRQSLP